MEWIVNQLENIYSESHILTITLLSFSSVALFKTLGEHKNMKANTLQIKQKASNNKHKKQFKMIHHLFTKVTKSHSATFNLKIKLGFIFLM